MSNRERSQEAQNQKWDEAFFGDYLNAVDDALESRCGRLSAQSELANISEGQESLCSPNECVPSYERSMDLH
ncbi:MAG: hypothetical protein JXR25_03665 [Pontiellaceae bacterium]|nr:hypothetical protein [Pontiellaceae bacterium]